MRTPADLHADHTANDAPIEWPVPEALARSKGIEARDRSAGVIATMDLGVAAPINGALSPKDMDALLRAAERSLLDRPLSGVGLDLGAGLGILSAVVARRPTVEFVLALEVCPNFVSSVIPRAAREVLGDSAGKVVPVLGSFEDLRIPDESIDFAVEIDSLHHADDLDVAVAECARVLRPGGVLVCFDRAHHDDLPEDLRTRMLDRVYTAQWIRDNGYPPGTTMTRRENGEHEIRISEWRSAFEQSGLELARLVHFEPQVTGRMAAKGLVSALPRPVRRRLVSLPTPPGYPTAWVRSRIGSPDSVGPIAFAPKHCTGMLARKP